MRAVDIFAGPGGWDVAARDLGIDVVGIEIDDSACDTREAAAPGHPWQGTNTAQYQQIGNAVPPLLSLHVLSAVTGAIAAGVAA